MVSSNRTRDADLLKEQERTDQVAYCTELEQPIERQYCLLSLNLDVNQQGDDNG